MVVQANGELSLSQFHLLEPLRTADAPLGVGELAAAAEVSAPTATRMLATLERDGLIERHVFARVPARVGYELSPAGQELLAALAPLAGWGVEHRADLFAAREQFDRMQEWRANREGMQARSRAGAPPSQII